MQTIGPAGGLGPGKLTKTVTGSASLRHLSGGEYIQKREKPPGRLLSVLTGDLR